MDFPIVPGFAMDGRTLTTPSQREISRLKREARKWRSLAEAREKAHGLALEHIDRQAEQIRDLRAALAVAVSDG